MAAGLDRYEVKLDDVFEGPMDLLVHLIKKNEVNIYDIPIALITDQYLEYLEWIKAMNIDLAGSFILMAATLAQIKSKMLLPVHDDDDDDDDDPRMEIIRPLNEYLQMKAAAEQLSQRDLLGQNTFTRSVPDMDIQPDSEDTYIQVGLFELIDAFRQILIDLDAEQQMDFSAERISIKDRINQIVEILEEKKSVTFIELFTQPVHKSDVVITFLAILEMVKLNLLNIAQHTQTGIIRLFYI
ncbi:MAG: chromosome segregation protein ScpA [Deltaproteobacteria bacterium]|nr:MAG: chromosome segregation protein ScpA [Deltaproteobacteria bacterium]